MSKRIFALRLTLIAALAALLSALLWAWCIVHALNIVHASEHSPGPFLCDEAAQEWMASLGLPLERTIPLGVLSAGFSLVALIQAVRFYNSGKNYQKLATDKDDGHR